MVQGVFPIHKNVQTIEHIRRELQKLGIHLSDIDDRLPPCLELTKTVDPTTTDDITKGVFPGCLWFNTVLDTFWINEDNTINAAVWTLLIGSGGVMEFDKVESHVSLLTLDTENEITFTE